MPLCGVYVKKRDKMQLVDIQTVDATSQDTSLHLCCRISRLLSAALEDEALMEEQGLQMN